MWGVNSMDLGALILVIIAAVVLIVVIMVFVFLHLNRRKMHRLSQRNQAFIQRQQSAVLGKALVVDARDGVTGEYATQTYMTLTLEVTPSGGQTYRTSARWLVELSALGFIQQGSEMPVKIDADDPKIIYPNAPWAKYIPE
jgi:hypothetical protein